MITAYFLDHELREVESPRALPVATPYVYFGVFNPMHKLMDLALDEPTFREVRFCLLIADESSAIYVQEGDR